jgi:hypothetical protein
MRIRKAVPEGYKTHKTHLADISNSRHDFADADAGFLQRLDDGDDAAAPRSRELTPFCGLHKVGGLAVQQDSWVRQMSGRAFGAGRPVDAFAGEGASAWGCSQESAVSVEDGARTVRSKRRLDERFDEGEAEEGEEDLEEVQWLQQQENFVPTNRRILAKPIRTRMANGSRRPHDGGAVQSLTLQQTFTGVTDFEEAGFLQPCDDGEVEMGGI